MFVIITSKAWIFPYGNDELYVLQEKEWYLQEQQKARKKDAIAIGKPSKETTMSLWEWEKRYFRKNVFKMHLLAATTNYFE